MSYYLRNSTCVLSALVGLALVGLWIRSYETADELNGWLGPQRFTLGSREGRAVIAAVIPNGNVDYGWKWHLRTSNTVTKLRGLWFDDRESTEADFSFAPGDLQRQTNRLGLGLIHRPCYFTWIPTKWVGGQPTVYRSSSARSMYCYGVIAPYWLLVLLTGVVFALVRLLGKWRFNIRSLIIAMTFLSILLSLIETVDHVTDVDPFEPGIPSAMRP